MPVQKSALKAAIKAAMLAERDKPDTPEASADRIAEALTNAVAAAIVDGVNTAVITLANAAGPVTGTIIASAV